MADYKPPGVGEERVSKTHRGDAKNFLAIPMTLKAALKLLNIVHMAIKIVAKVTDIFG